VRPVPILVAALVGCSGASAPSATPTVIIEAPAPAPEATEPPPAHVTSVPTRPKPAVEAEGVIGVPECDEYLTRFAACLKKMPPQTHGAVKHALDQTRQAWARLAANPEAHTGLATGCRAALDAFAENPMCR